MAQFAAEVHAVVERYRDAIALAESGDLQAANLGRMVFDERVRLTGELRASLDRPSAIKGFLSTLDRDRTLYDGDRLAFLDLVVSLRDGAEGKTLARIEAEIADLREIQRVLADEARWDAYASAIRPLRSVEQLLEAHRDELADHGSTDRAWKDNDLEVFGTTLPDKTFVLTFDDGPSAEHTPRILDILKEHGVRAVFFEVGEHVASVGEGEPADRDPRSRVDPQDPGGGALARQTHLVPPEPAETFRPELPPQVHFAGKALDWVNIPRGPLSEPPKGNPNCAGLGPPAKTGGGGLPWKSHSPEWGQPNPHFNCPPLCQNGSGPRGPGCILLAKVAPHNAGGAFSLSSPQVKGPRVPVSVLGRARGKTYKTPGGNPPQKSPALLLAIGGAYLI